MKAAAVWAMPVEVGAPAVALTFDDGPDPRTTPQVVETLVDCGVTATFFVVGELAARHPQVVQLLAEAGMGIGVHGWDHTDLSDEPAASVASQLEQSLDVLRGMGTDPHLFRPAYGLLYDHIVDAAAERGLATVKWSVDPGDWTCPGVDVIAARVRERLEPGAIVLLHDGGGDRRQTVDALPLIVDDCRQAGLVVVDLLTQLTG